MMQELASFLLIEMEDWWIDVVSTLIYIKNKLVLP